MRKFILVLLALQPLITYAENLPDQFVYLSDIEPSILQEIRYAGPHNFIGRPIKGYKSGECIMTRPAAEALKNVQADLKKSGYSLKVYDCYRPQKAVDDFVAWSKQVAHQEMKAEYYPRVNKADFFKLGYVAEKSGHTRGSTVDLTLVQLPDHAVDMGTTYDFMDELSHSNNQSINKTAYKNRQLLYWAMEKYGFVNLPTEWWHFTFKDEPYRDKYFNVDVQAKLPSNLDIPRNSKQVLVVRVNTPDVYKATMLRYERRTGKANWQVAGAPIPVVIGKKGITSKKQEGDLRTPSGAFKIDTAFGFALSMPATRMPYQQLKATSVCVDDASSPYYNQLFDAANTKSKDWRSAEQMREIPLYKLGAYIAYNNKRQPNAGSCIFLHLWKSQDDGTAGCVAMAEPDLMQILSWLDPKKQPMIAILNN